MLNPELEAWEKEVVDTDIVEGEYVGTEQVGRALQAFVRHSGCWLFPQWDGALRAEVLAT